MAQSDVHFVPKVAVKSVLLINHVRNKYYINSNNNSYV